MSNIVIDVAAQFTGAKAFKQAETATDKLTKNVKNLGRTLGLTLSAAAITAYGKAAVKAAADDAKAQAILAQQLKNVGQAFAVSQVEAYISSQERLTGILDDKLRPAFGKLVTVTGSATQSQYLLGIAMDAAAGTGQDLESVTQALAQAYQGNTKGLKSLNLGLTQAQLKAAKFGDVISRINTLYAGQGKVAADSYAGSLQKIDTAAKNAQETIGYGLIDAFKALGDNQSVDQVTSDMQHFADTTADAIRGVGVLAGQLNKLTGTSNLQPPSWLEALGFYGVGGAIANIVGAKSKPKGVSGGASDRYWMNQQKQAAKLQKEKNALSVIDNANTARKLTLTADQIAMQELQKKFDLDRIQIQAALNNTTDKETTARLNALMVIQDNNNALAKKALAELDAAKAAEDFARRLRNNYDQLDALNAKIAAKLAANAASDLMASASRQAAVYQPIIDPSSPYYFQSTEASTEAARSAIGAQSINITLDGQVFQNAVVGAVNQASASGSALSYTQTATR